MNAALLRHTTRWLRHLDTRLGRRSGARRILVDARTPVNFVMAAPIWRAMAGDPRITFHFTASEDPGRLAEIYAGAGPSARVIAPARAALTRFDAYIASDFMWATLPRGTRRVQIFHGVGGKYGFDAPRISMREWDRLFFVNERRLRNFVAAGAIDPDSPAIRLVGMPKTDCLVDGSLQRVTVLRSMGLDPDRPTVLYAPTWSPASSLNVLGMELIRRVLDLPVNLLVKLHDRSRDPRPRYSGGIDWAARLDVRLRGNPARLVAGADICPALAAADVMITDHSSAGFEYLLLDRPIVRIHLPSLIRAANIHRDYVALLSRVSRSVGTVPAAMRAVERALADPGDGSPARRGVAAELFFRPGTATSRSVDALYELIDLPCPSRIAAAQEVA
jgi:hypothetical protein